MRLAKVTLLLVLISTVVTISPTTAHAASCFGDQNNLAAIDCSGSISTNKPSSPSSSPSSLQRRSNAYGPVSKETLQYSEFFPGNSLVTDIKNICDASLSFLVPNLDCPEGNNTTNPQGPTQEQLAELIATEFFQKVTLPTPQPKMSSPDGVCGGIHSLDLQIPDEYIFESDTPLGKLTLHAYGQTTINWGDGKTEQFNSTGAPYPDSEIAHSWPVKGTYTIHSTVNWSADWSIGTISQGTIDGRMTENSITNWQVVELQAILR